MAHTSRQQGATKSGVTAPASIGPAARPARRRGKTSQPTVESDIIRVFKSKAFASLMARDPSVARAVVFLTHQGVVTGVRSKKISTRVDPGVMDAARKRFGLTNDADVINASLAMAAAPDRFKTWLMESQDTVTDDFELAV
ncbi:hypothetical protein Gdia_0969 [Gluconacetobacter diazotrophicus PA1 5]|uniref:hypothetical protein n=1 Tax=Acetobacteraceae TaxID=433 RepID=UPI000173BC18|nr:MULTISPECIES: hypothetical protein [Acetobacteraceae]ACI50753.1 hypothetical protein Gdia_0969 [Gluconacetobacter diazotrophicus PA1 5]MCE2564783.1 hypothetical protein [Komagataeibacter sp. FNDCF1]